MDNDVSTAATIESLRAALDAARQALNDTDLELAKAMSRAEYQTTLAKARKETIDEMKHAWDRERSRADVLAAEVAHLTEHAAKLEATLSRANKQGAEADAKVASLEGGWKQMMEHNELRMNGALDHIDYTTAAVSGLLSLIDGLPWQVRDSVYAKYNERVGALPGSLPEPIKRGREMRDFLALDPAKFEGKP